jgi:hypothetical protein
VTYLATAAGIVTAFAVGLLLGDQRSVKQANEILDTNVKELFKATSSPFARMMMPSPRSRPCIDQVDECHRGPKKMVPVVRLDDSHFVWNAE